MRGDHLVGSNGKPINDLTISASLIPVASGYEGIVTAGAQPADNAGFSIGTTGVVDGQFYGPVGGLEYGATLRLIEGDNILTGAIQAH